MAEENIFSLKFNNVEYENSGNKHNKAVIYVLFDNKKFSSNYYLLIEEKFKDKKFCFGYKEEEIQQKKENSENNVYVAKFTHLLYHPDKLQNKYSSLGQDNLKVVYQLYTAFDTLYKHMCIKNKKEAEVIISFDDQGKTFQATYKFV